MSVVQTLVNVLFKKHNDTFVEIQLGPASTVYDLFRLCLDLLLAGLLLMYSSPQGAVNVANITMEQFEELRKKLQYAYIGMELNVVQLGYDIHPCVVTPSKYIIGLDDLTDYKVIINNDQAIKMLNFRILRPDELYILPKNDCHAPRLL